MIRGLPGWQVLKARRRQSLLLWIITVTGIRFVRQ